MLQDDGSQRMYFQQGPCCSNHTRYYDLKPCWHYDSKSKGDGLSVKVILSFWRKFPVPTMLNPLIYAYLDGNQFQVGVVIQAQRKINAPQRLIGAPQRWIHRNWVSQTVISSQVTTPYLIVRLTSSPFKTVDKQWLWSCFMPLVGYYMSTGNDTSCIVSKFNRTSWYTPSIA